MSRKRKKRDEILYKGDLCKRKKSCRYGCRVGGIWFCNYFCMTGERRGCEANKCDKFRPSIDFKKEKIEKKKKERQHKRELISYNLLRLLECKGVTRAELAERVEVPRKNVDNWCRGEALPRIERLKGIAKVLGVEVKEFEKEKPNEENDRL